MTQKLQKRYTFDSPFLWELTSPRSLTSPPKQKPTLRSVSLLAPRSPSGQLQTAVHRSHYIYLKLYLLRTERLTVSKGAVKPCYPHQTSLFLHDFYRFLTVSSLYLDYAMVVCW